MKGAFILHQTQINILFTQRIKILLIYLFTYLLIYLFTYLLIYLFTYLLIYLFTYLLIYLFTYLLIYLFTYLLIYLFTYPFCFNTIFNLVLGKTFQGPKDATVFYKEFHQFQCILPDGYPKPKFIEWRKDGIPLRSNSLADNIRLLKNNGIHVLQIESAERKNAGEYVCVARNQEGERISPGASLRVIARGDILLTLIYHLYLFVPVLMSSFMVILS